MAFQFLLYCGHGPEGFPSCHLMTTGAGWLSFLSPRGRKAFLPVTPYSSNGTLLRMAFLPLLTSCNLGRLSCLEAFETVFRCRASDRLAEPFLIACRSLSTPHWPCPGLAPGSSTFARSSPRTSERRASSCVPEWRHHLNLRWGLVILYQTYVATHVWHRLRSKSTLVFTSSQALSPFLQCAFALT